MLDERRSIADQVSVGLNAADVYALWVLTRAFEVRSWRLRLWGAKIREGFRIVDGGQHDDADTRENVFRDAYTGEELYRGTGEPPWDETWWHWDRILEEAEEKVKEARVPIGLPENLADAILDWVDEMVDDAVGEGRISQHE